MCPSSEGSSSSSGSSQRRGSNNSHSSNNGGGGNYFARTRNNINNNVSEIERMSAKENARVTVWRYAVTAMLAMTTAVTISAYIILDREEHHNFQTAFEQFSRTLGDAAVRQQKALRDSLAALCNDIGMFAKNTEAEWPYFHLPNFENYAEDFLRLSNAEFVAVNNRVTREQREQYEAYVNMHHEEWAKQGHLIKHGNLDKLDMNLSKYNPFIARRTGNGGFVPEEDRDVYFARIAFSPPPRTYGPLINWNMGGPHTTLLQSLRDLRNETLTNSHRRIQVLPKDEHAGYHTDSEADNPHSFMFRAVYEDPENSTSELAAVVSAAFAWDASMLRLLPEGVAGIVSVVENDCNQSFTYEINGGNAYYRGEGDKHDRNYDHMVVSVDLTISNHPNFTSAPGHCQYRMQIYPSDYFREAYDTNLPEIFASVVACAFGMVALFFLVYDTMVQRRNNKIVTTAARSTHLVSTLFPDAIRDRVLAQQTGPTPQPLKSASNMVSFPYHERFSDEEGQGDQPLAELFPDATVFFADIAGFTAWSSTREPTKVFLLLEALYVSFDQIANRRGVFKVETVGDCYVAVTGVHPKRCDHAIVMARFARDCMTQMQVLTKSLEVTLGPDTGDLRLRIGMHSGPVTAGVLRGEKARFQLFGDTVNTASRMESTGQPGEIHISKRTADMIADAGKDYWIRRRIDTVTVKGKGVMETYWLSLNVSSQVASSQVSVTAHNDARDSSSVPDARAFWDGEVPNIDDRTSRLVEWNVELLVRLLREIASQRSIKMPDPEVLTCDDTPLTETTPLDEVKEIIRLPDFDVKLASQRQEPAKVAIPLVVVEELKDFVSCVARLYRPNPFHNFAHASHVTMSVIKLMSRIVAAAPPPIEGKASTSSKNSSNNRKGKNHPDLASASWRHDNSCGITSDPLTQFACAFSALIHDVDHRGVSNTQLMKEDTTLSSAFKGRSVAEQNSFDICWRLLMEGRFARLRVAICSTKEELARFRQLVINSVMATDLLDQELKVLRNARWLKAFNVEMHPEQTTNATLRDSVDRKATIIIEHLIQASDVAHTMQHWHIYRKWNEKLFEELYEAYRAGRAEKDPTTFWYEGELKFFDYYVIPLAKKLKDCGVFGVSSDEYLNYAVNNRNEWETRGRDVVEEMVDRINVSEV